MRPTNDVLTVPRALLRTLMPSLAVRGAPLDVVIHTVVQNEEGTIGFALDHDRSTQRGVNARRVVERAARHNIQIDIYRLTVEALHALDAVGTSARRGTSHLVTDVAEDILRRYPNLEELYPHAQGGVLGALNSRINTLHRGDLPNIVRELRFYNVPGCNRRVFVNLIE